MTVEKKSVEKILIVRMSSLGDIVLTSPVYRNIKNHWPDAHITLLTKKKFESVGRSFKYVDDVLIYKNLFAALKEIKTRRFTHYLDIHSNMRSIFLGLFSSIKNKAKYQKNSLARRLFVKLKIITPALQRHTLDKYLNSLRKWNIPIKYTEPSLSDWEDKTAEIDISKQTKKIVILQTAFLGDTVLAVPLIKETAKIFKNSSITVVTRPETAEIFRPLKEVKNIIVDDKKSGSKLKSIKKLICNLKSHNFDIALVAHRSFRSALAVYLAKIPERVGFTSSAGQFLLTKKIPFSWLVHDAERNLSLLKPFKSHFDTGGDSTLKSNSDAKQKINELLAGYGLKDTSLAAIHPGSVWFTKRWPKENYAKLIEKLWNELKIRAVLVGSKSDHKLAEDIIKLSGKSNPVNFTGKTTISELMALMERLKLFVTNDSGPMHIAAAFGVPVAAIFGPTTKELGFFPYSKKSVVIEKKLKCRPCSLHGKNKCPHKHFLCMKLISHTEVFNSSKKLLSIL